MRFLVLFLVAFLATHQHAAAQFGGLKIPLGGGSSSSSGASAADSQEALVLRAHAALVDILEGQRLFALAFGYDDKAKALAESIDLIKKDTSKDGLETAVNLAEETNAMIKEAAAKKVEVSAEQSKYYEDGLLLFARGTHHCMKLVPELVEWGKSAPSEIKGAGVMRGAMMQQKLGTVLFLLETLPKLAPAFFSTLMGDVLRIGKSNKLDTSGANEANFN